MAEFRWPVIVITALLALGLFFGLNHYRQRFLKEEPFLDSLCLMESIDQAELSREGGTEILIITPSQGYRGTLQDLIAAIRERVDDQFKKPLLLKIKDKRSSRLESFNRAVSPDLYEAARLGNYRSVAESVELTAAAFGLEDVLFTVDYEYLYLQARDGEHYFYLIIPLDHSEAGGGGA